jgi:hypothetical protein
MSFAEVLRHPAALLTPGASSPERGDLDPVYLPGALTAGVVGAIAALTLQLLVMPFVLGTTLYAPLQMIAATVLGSDVMTTSGVFDGGVLVAALLVQLALSVGYAFGLAWLVRCRPTVTAVGIGALGGLVLYGLHLYAASALFPWFAELRGLPMLVIHLAFGMLVAWSYRSIEEC